MRVAAWLFIVALVLAACTSDAGDGSPAGDGSGAAEGSIRVALGDIEGVETLNLLIALERVRERGIDVESMLVITYTERAAGELKSRIRARLHELGRHDLARSLDGAWISTIHGFCLRLLKSHPFAAGLDPRFRVLDDSQGRVIRGEAFEAALNEFCAGDAADRLVDLAVRRGAPLVVGCHVVEGHVVTHPESPSRAARSLARHRPRVGPMLPIGMPSASATCA